MKWDHWETIAGSKVAIFVYSVPQPASHYVVRQPWLDKSTNITPGYHGQIAIRPTDGAVMRFTMIAELGPKELVQNQNLLVEYGEVTIGSKPYICPSRSVMVSLIKMQHAGDVNVQTTAWTVDTYKTLGPAQTRMNDVRFSDYH
jgi:hypothetical protein